MNDPDFLEALYCIERFIRNSRHFQLLLNRDVIFEHISSRIKPNKLYVFNEDLDFEWFNKSKDNYFINVDKELFYHPNVKPLYKTCVKFIDSINTEIDTHSVVVITDNNRNQVLYIRFNNPNRGN